MGKFAKYVEIELDRPRRLLYNLNAMAAYEDKTGKNFLDISNETVNATLLRVVLWAGLIHEDKSLTVEQVGELLNSENMMDIQKKIVAAASANIPDSKESTKDPNAPPPAP
jgi:hypothetical protein